jgi:hypothetical protein
MKKTVVFDFDKTLTMHDTLLSFFCFNEKKTLLFFFKFCIYILCMVLTKFNIIHNISLKKIGIYLFLRHINLSHLNDKLQEFSESDYVQYSKLYKGLIFDTNTNYYVVSASFEEYIKPMFPGFVQIIGSKLTQDRKNRTVLEYNCFGKDKPIALLRHGINHIDEFYTDSYDDLPLAKISKNIIIVDGDDLVRCNNVYEFIDFFKR